MMGQCVQHGRQEKPDNTCRLEVDVAGGDVIHLDDDGVCYVGQTSRTLFERAGEHVTGLKNFKSDSFM